MNDSYAQQIAVALQNILAQLQQMNNNLGTISSRLNRLAQK